MGGRGYNGHVVLLERLQNASLHLGSAVCDGAGLEVDVILFILLKAIGEEEILLFTPRVGDAKASVNFGPKLNFFP